VLRTFRSDCELEVCGNYLLVPISFQLPSNHSHSHSNPFPFQHCIPIPIFPIISIPIPTHSRSHFGQRLYTDYLKAEKYVGLYCVVNSKQNIKLQQKYCNQTYHSSVTIIIIITITANHCSLFTVQRLSGVTEHGWEFYFSTIKYAIPIPIRTIPISIPISSPKLLPFSWNPMGIPWEWQFPFPCTPLLRTTGSIERAPGSGRPRKTRTAENVDIVGDLVQSQENQPQTHRSTRQISRELGISQTNNWR